MAGGIMGTRRSGSSRRDRPSRRSQSLGALEAFGWLPVALGTAAIVAGLGPRTQRTMAIAFTAFAGMTAVGAMRGGQLHGEGAAGSGRGIASVREPEVEVERSITIGKAADELRRRLLDPATLPQIMASFASVRAIGDGRAHWKIQGPLGRTYEWNSETVYDRPGDGIGWLSLPRTAIPNEGSVRFRPAPADRGTVVTLHLRFDPPGGVLGDALVKFLGTTPLGLAADQALHRFKSLVETGEIPTTERQPAARADTR